MVGEARLGVIEGFYGVPWSWAARDRMVDFMADHGFAIYVYAPKDDPLHRAQWRDLYLPEELEEFERLVRRCRGAGVEFVYGLSPIDVAHSEKDDLQVLWDKASQMAGVGVRSFCLLFDDLPAGLPDDDAEHVALAHRQAGVAVELCERLRTLCEPETFIFTPTEYHGRGDSPYLATIGAELPAEWEVFWTGPQICSHTIEASDLAAVTDSLRRRPLLWDNYPVNDGEMRHDPHLRPIRGRGADLPSAVSGLVANPALQAEASKIPLHTLAAYWRDPTGYEPEAAWTDALRAVAGDPTDADAVGLLGGLARRSPIEPGYERRTLALFADFWARWERESQSVSRCDALAELHERLSLLRDAGERLAGGTFNRRLGGELEPWARKLAEWVEASEASVALLRAALGESQDGEVPIARRRVVSRLASARLNPHRVADTQFETFVRRSLWQAEALVELPARA